LHHLENSAEGEFHYLEHLIRIRLALALNESLCKKQMDAFVGISRHRHHLAQLGPSGGLVTSLLVKLPASAFQGIFTWDEGPGGDLVEESPQCVAILAKEHKSLSVQEGNYGRRSRVTDDIHIGLDPVGERNALLVKPKGLSLIDLNDGMDLGSG
jgi:hypothetical protein